MVLWADFVYVHDDDDIVIPTMMVFFPSFDLPFLGEMSRLMRCIQEMNSNTSAPQNDEIHCKYCAMQLSSQASQGRDDPDRQVTCPLGWSITLRL